MDVGDRVVYVLNDEIDLNRDAGTIVGWDECDQECPRVLFDDDNCFTVDRTDLKVLVEKKPKQAMLHGHFGCLQTPCPWPGHS